MTVTARTRLPHSRACIARNAGHVATTTIVAQTTAGRNGRRTQKLAPIKPPIATTDSRIRVRSQDGGGWLTCARCVRTFGGVIGAGACALREKRRPSTNAKLPGMINTPRNVAISMPQNTAVPMTFCAPEPAPLASMSGTTPRMNAKAVIKIGRKRRRADSSAASSADLAGIVLGLGELDDEDRVLGGEANEHDQADLHVDVVVVAHEPDAEEGAERDQRRAEQHGPRQAPALVHRGQQQEHEHDGEDERRHRRRRGLLLVRQRGVGEAHLLRHRLREHGLQRGQRLPRREAAARRTADLHRAEQVEARGDLGARDRADRDERRERDHGVRPAGCGRRSRRCPAAGAGSRPRPGRTRGRAARTG